MELNVNESVTVYSSIPLRRVLSFALKWEVNKHGYAEIESEIPYESALKCGRHSYYNTGIIIKMTVDGNDNILFNGLLRKMELQFEGKIVKAHIEGVTASWKLDVQKRSRSYKDTGITYASLVKEMARRSGAEVITTCGRDIKLGKPLIQYQETDWEFARRCASHLNQKLLCDVRTGKAAFWFGMRDGKHISDLYENDYTVISDYSAFYRSFVVKSQEAYEVGDRMMFQGRPVVIYKREAGFCEGALSFSYTMCEEAYLKQDIIYNENIAGTGLSGIVEASAGETVDVRLEIDQYENRGSYMYPWRPETGNIMYAMPEKGCPVILTMTGCDERDAVVTSCLHRESEDKRNVRRYKKRCMNIQNTSMLKLYPGELSLSKRHGRRALILDDEEGISVESDKRVELTASDRIRLEASAIFVNASEEIKGIVG